MDEPPGLLPQHSGTTGTTGLGSLFAVGASHEIGPGVQSAHPGAENRDAAQGGIVESGVSKALLDIPVRLAILEPQFEPPARRIVAADPPSVFSLEAVAAALDGAGACAAERRRKADRASERDRVAGSRTLPAPSSNGKGLAEVLVVLGSLRERRANSYQEKLNREREDARRTYCYQEKLGREREDAPDFPGLGAARDRCRRQSPGAKRPSSRKGATSFGGRWRPRLAEP